MAIEETNEPAASPSNDLGRAFIVTLVGPYDEIEYRREPLAALLKGQEFELLYVLKDQVSEKIACLLYPHVYRIENLLRGYLIRFMATHIGPRWWELTASSEMTQKAKMRKKNERVFGRYIENSAYLIDFDELGEIVYEHSPGFRTREDIEEAFLQWRNVEWIDQEFELEGGRSAIYRHAHALNLFRKRSLNLRSALEYIIEESERIMPSAEGIVKAMRAYTRINDVGEWIDPPTKHIVQVIAIPATEAGNPNSVPGLALDVRKDRSQIIESGIRQPLLTETAQQSENVVTD